jgi:peptide/nickel transport system ATP-binding protein
VKADDVVITAEDLRVWYGTAGDPVRAVDGVAFELRAGEILGLVGESGCGKSTLGRGLLGLLPDGAARDGRLFFRDRDMLRLKRREQHALRGRELGLIFQEPLTRLDPLMRISDHFAETLRTHHRGISKDEIESRSLEALRVMGIPPTRFRAYPHEFSGGMRQRLMIALTLVLRPAFVVADEPTTALDVLVEAQIIRMLHDLRDTYETALLLITHNLGIIAEACDRVAVMYAGEIVEIGDAREVFADPQHPYTRALAGAFPTIGDLADRHAPAGLGGDPPRPTALPTGCTFHPRCPDARPECASTDVELWPAGPGREAACVLAPGAPVRVP